MNLGRWLAGLWVLATASCSVVLAGDDRQCDRDEDCAARGFEGTICEERVCVEPATVDPTWGCLGNVVEPTPDTTQTLEFTLKLVYASGGAPVTDATIDICARLDIDCTGATSADFPKGITPAADGSFTATIRQGFDGFVQVRAADIMDTRIYVGRPLIEPPSLEQVRVLKPNEYQALSAAIAGKQPDLTRGTVIGLVVDCQTQAAAGVRFSTTNADAESDEFYLIGQSPVKPPAATATDRDGFGGFFNLPPGAMVLRAVREATDQYVGESSLQILPNTISFVLVAPTPQ